MSGYKKSLNNPYLFDFLSNDPSDLFNYTMNNIMDGFYDSAMNTSTDGKFKAVCLSGIRTEDGTGAGTDANDAQKDAEYISVIVRPLTDFGNIIPDPRKFNDPDEINANISLHGSMFLARSDYSFKSENPVSFGQIIDCYFENGSIINSDFKTLRFSEPKDKMIERSFERLSLISGVSKLASNSWNDASLLGEDNINTSYPPRTATYKGANQNFNGKTVENGRIPSELISRAKKGGANKPIILKELVSSYDKMAEAFATKFPGKQIGAWGYRTYERQLSIKKEKPNLAAKPGTSNHGWGMAIDMHYFEQGRKEPKSLNYSSEEYRWLNSNAIKFGWENPQWASQGGSKEEPWHWEWRNKSQIISRNK